MRKLFLSLLVLVAATMQAQVIDTLLNKVSQKPFSISFAVPDGNYRVTVTLGNKKRPAQTVVRAESRRLMVENCTTKKGCFETYSFVVSKRSPEIQVAGVLEGCKNVAEWSFHPDRKWRFDYALPDLKIAIEVDGGVFTGGRHSGGVGQVKDMEKCNHAASLGWLVFHIIPDEMYDLQFRKLVQNAIEMRKNAEK